MVRESVTIVELGVTIVDPAITIVDPVVTIVDGSLTMVMPGAVAVAWTLRNPAVNGAIVGRGLRLSFLSQLEMMLLTAVLSGPTGRENRAQG